MREIIYTYALTYSQPIQLQKRSYHRFWRIGYKVSRALRTRFNYTPSLLRTCTQIQSEASPLFFRNNIFRIDVSDGNLGPLFEWLNDTPPSLASLVKGLVIKVDPTCVAQVAELAERAEDRDGLWKQAAAFADGVSRAGVDVESVRCLVGECKGVSGDSYVCDGEMRMEPEVAREVAERWVQALIGVLEAIEALEDEVDAEALADGMIRMELTHTGIGIAR